MFRIPGPASYMTPLDFFLIIDCTGTDPSLYKMKGFVTGEKFYSTIGALRSAFEAGELGMEFDQTLDADWALVDYKPELGVRELEDRLAPATLEIGGKRYKVDEMNQYVEYMGWSFYLAFSRTLGVMFYDIKFKGERILYELSMQEATAQYGGNQPKAANTVYHDTYYRCVSLLPTALSYINVRNSLGMEMGTLVEGYDCPWVSIDEEITREICAELIPCGSIGIDFLELDLSFWERISRQHQFPMHVRSRHELPVIAPSYGRQQ
jgi:primary-amine oxidase